MRLFISSLNQSSSLPPLPVNGVRVFLITGQSNARGRGLNSDATTLELTPNPNVKIWNTSTNQFETLEIGVNNMSPTPALNHGIELQLAANLSDYYPDETICIIKYGVGSSCIDTHLLGGSSYQTFNDSYVKEGINNLLTDGKRPFVSMVWGQGECDVNANNTNYDTDFAEWVSLWQGNLGLSLPIVTFEVSDGTWNTQPISLVNDVFHAKELTESYLTALYTKDESTFSSDTVHYDYDGQKAISVKTFNVLKNYLGVEITTPL